jgi:hypothetical protein
MKEKRVLAGCRKIRKYFRLQRKILDKSGFLLYKKANAFSGFLYMLPVSDFLLFVVHPAGWPTSSPIREWKQQAPQTRPQSGDFKKS